MKGLRKRTIMQALLCLMLTAALLLAGCARKASDSGETGGTDPGQTSGAAELVTEEQPAAEPSETETEEPAAPAEPETEEPASPAETSPEEPETAPEPEAKKYEFNPHLYVPFLDADIPQDYWDSLYHLCDALRAGETTFACSSAEAYKWVTYPPTLNQLFPAACVQITGESNDGSVPFENGVGRIYYRMPIDEFVERQARFEALVADVLNTCLEPDDDDYEKCLKLYDYMSSNYVYEEEFVEEKHDGATYLTILTGTGQCVDLGSAYAYFLLQSGVEAMEIGGSGPGMDHDWTYIVLDGKGYHSDPTWGLRSAEDSLPLYYFLMTEERRADDGFYMDNLTVPLLPLYWVKRSATEFPSEDDTYCFPHASFLTSLDEENKVVYYKSFGEPCEFHYAQAEQPA